MSALLADLLPGPVVGVFVRMDVAEEEISRAGNPEALPFLALCPPPEFQGLALWLYRAHARELCERARDGSRLRAATYAEITIGMHRTTLVAPPAQEFGAAYAVAMKRAAELGDHEVPEHLVDQGGPAGWREPWPGRSEEILKEARRKLAVKDRVLLQLGHRRSDAVDSDQCVQGEGEPVGRSRRGPPRGRCGPREPGDEVPPGGGSAGDAVATAPEAAPQGWLPFGDQ